VNLLDNIRLYENNDELLNFFHHLFTINAQKAIQLINDTNLCSPSFHTLCSTFNDLNIFDYLNLRNRYAFIISKELLNHEQGSDTIKALCIHHESNIHQSMKWIVESSYLFHKEDESFDEIHDKCACILTKTFKDQTILPCICSTIFNRHRKRLFIFDLVWAFFEAANPYSLKLIANYLKAPQDKDRTLACKLLGFIPGIDPSLDKETLFANFNNWFSKNHTRLRYTGESFQQCSKPIPFEII
jgi:hypothetical protein